MAKRSLRPRRNGDNDSTDSPAATGRKRKNNENNPDSATPSRNKKAKRGPIHDVASLLIFVRDVNTIYF